jgi:hypothetical protein
MGKAVVLLGCGDVGPIHEPMAQYSELVRDTLAGVDIRFAQVERVYSERGELQPHGGAHDDCAAHDDYRLRVPTSSRSPAIMRWIGARGAARHA